VQVLSLVSGLEGRMVQLSEVSLPLEFSQILG
jgi:hypothetical protein